MKRAMVMTLALFGASCGGSSSEDGAVAEVADRYSRLEMEPGEPEPMMEEAEADDWGGDAAGGAPMLDAVMEKSAMPAMAAPKDRAKKEEGKLRQRPGAKGGKADNDGGGERVREWFPESFLWQPLVETGPTGATTIDVRVPDQLTTWRILALAHTREGQQAGAVHSFDSRLPVYVDPVVPGWLYAGDTVALPVQVVNTTSAAVESVLSVDTEGALSGTGVASVSLGANGTSVQHVVLGTAGAGSSRVKARLEGADAAERSILVHPTGRPVRNRRGGTLAGPRSFALSSPTGLDPTTQKLTVHVFAGPLSVLQAEVDRVGSGAATPWAAAYSFALANELTVLAGRTGAAYDAKAVRRLKLLGWQRVVRHARAPSPGVAADLLAAMRGVSDHELAEELERRLVRTLVQGQRGGGDWARQGSGSMKLILAQTAFAARVLPESEKGARMRAEGAVARYARDIEDPYTAAIVLASGLATGELATRLETMVDEAVSERSDGAHTIGVPSGAVNPWGMSPTRAEMLAWTVLARPEADYRGDLVAELMTGYDATWGFGAGPADVIALEAVTKALPGISQPVDVVLTVDGAEVSRHTLDPAQPKVPAVLLATPAGSTGKIGLRAEPEVPGLAWVATLDSWVPWSGEERIGGVEIEVEAGDWTVGRDGTLNIALSAPSGTALTIEQGLPAGTTIDEVALKGLSGALASHEVRQDKVIFTTKRFAAGEIIEVPLVARPAFAGTFTTAPMSVSTNGGLSKDWLAPVAWDVGG